MKLAFWTPHKYLYLILHSWHLQGCVSFCKTWWMSRRGKGSLIQTILDKGGLKIYHLAKHPSWMTPNIELKNRILTTFVIYYTKKLSMLKYIIFYGFWLMYCLTTCIKSCFTFFTIICPPSIAYNRCYVRYAIMFKGGIGEPRNLGTKESQNPDYWILIYILRIFPDFRIP